MNFQIPNLMPVMPEIFLLIMILIVLLVESFCGEKYKKLGYYLTHFALIGALVLTIHLFHFQTDVTLNDAFILDHASCILKIFIYASSSFVLLYSNDYVRDHSFPYGEYFVLFLLVVLGMSVLVSAYNFISLYLGLELLSLPLYAMIALQRNSTAGAEASMKFFITGAVASGMLLYGLSLIYGATGSIGMQDVANKIAVAGSSTNLILMCGLIFSVVGVAFKLGAVPFHMWVPDVYDGAPNSVTLFIASATKVAAFGLAMRILVDTFHVFQPEWQSTVVVISILSMALGNLVAIVQTNIKRMLAYSSIAHMGYMLLGFISGTSTGYGAAMFYMIVYAIMSLGAFGLLVLLSRAGFEVEKIDDLKGLNTRNSWLAFLMLLLMFSMAGVPPSAGFFAKIAVLESLISIHMVWLAALSLAFAIIGAYYYLRIVKVMYFDEPETKGQIFVPGIVQNVAISVNGLAVLALGVIPTGLFNLCELSFSFVNSWH